MKCPPLRRANSEVRKGKPLISPHTRRRPRRPQARSTSKGMRMMTHCKGEPKSSRVARKDLGVGVPMSTRNTSRVPSGAEARGNGQSYTARLKPCPFKEISVWARGFGDGGGDLQHAPALLVKIDEFEAVEEPIGVADHS